MMANLKLLSMILGFGTALSFLIAAAWRIRSLMRGEIQLGLAETACTAVVFGPSTGWARSVSGGCPEKRKCRCNNLAACHSRL